MKYLLVKQYHALILLATKQPTFYDKVCYFGKVVAALGPVVAIIDALSIWFYSNSNFIAVMLGVLVINMGIGIWYHHVMGTFSWRLFMGRNAEMFLVIFVVYILLELLRFVVGNNVVGNGFKVLVQTTTIIYPVSKSLKNIYILSEKRHPPAFIMERLYKFEKTGDIKDLIENDKTE